MRRFTVIIGVLLVSMFILSSASADSSKFGFLADDSQNLNSLRFSYTQNESPVDTGSSKSLKNTSLRLKDPNKAILYAIFPGVFAHGAGHFYGGDSKTGTILLCTETFGFIVLFGFFGRAIEELSGDAAAFMKDPYIRGGMGIVLFFGSWYYDIFHSPQAAKDYNEKLLMKKGIGLKINSSSINIVFEFN